MHVAFAANCCEIGPEELEVKRWPLAKALRLRDIPSIWARSLRKVRLLQYCTLPKSHFTIFYGERCCTVCEDTARLRRYNIRSFRYQGPRGCRTPTRTQGDPLTKRYCGASKRCRYASVSKCTAPPPLATEVFFRCVDAAYAARVIIAPLAHCTPKMVT